MLSAAGTGCVLFSLLSQLWPYECRLLTRRHCVYRFFYTTTKNPRNVTRKLSLRKYDPIVRQHVIFNETKIKKG
ncbi:hypothetical protein PR001_g4486 [Phytophthora rubi]|uniref:Large ribosomal subunit protein bL33c n=1 Tax=Phytophthora rubi TaxID=129364 RepID=A0A6A3NTQ6_9STRA|nr:hypothetical protein PR002_g6522 [Phytophthora rubi]KAE9046643.1 hypothetical protein PR001_g4486 [Phytophthora rubi]